MGSGEQLTDGSGDFSIMPNKPKKNKNKAYEDII